MSDQFVGEIRIFAGNFAPTGWALCNGQLLPISQNTALFSILGTNFGGDGRTNFGLPNLQARFPLHAGAGPGLTLRQLGESDGVPSVALGTAQIPSHGHALHAATASTTGTPGATVGLAPPASGSIYHTLTHPVLMDPSSIGPVGQGIAHENRQPFLVLSFIIALQGIFPPRG